MENGGPSQPKYKGIRLRKWGKWVSEVRLPNSRERIWLGSYDTAEKAARAFDAAQFCLRGPKAKFNFPDSPPDISLSDRQRLSPAEIQAIAARFANDDHSHSQSSSVVQEIRPLPSHGHDYEGNMSNINSHVTNMEKDEMSLSSTTCNDPVVQMDTNNNSTATAAMAWASFDMWEDYPHHAIGPPPDLFCDPHSSYAGTNYDSGYYPAGVLDSLSSNLYSPPHFPQRVTHNYDDDDTGNGGDEHYTQQSFLWNF
ncbi:ethylene-responsive transcription factor [Capsicum annuum]|uniref:ethylene-responsive transcription factor ERF016 n=1 Tax=Capsicum annuum TaxID=4072 RepID=UPI001FB0BA14|nr:ethylene-responsive transcription factor ERF016 [Capsicum annuum]